MGFLAGKRLLVTGVLSNRSIAYGIARACRREGAELAFSYQGERFKERVAEFAAEFGSTLRLRLRRRRRCPDRGDVRRAGRRPGRPSTASSTRSASRPRRRSPATSSRGCRARRSGSPTTSRATASRPWPRRRRRGSRPAPPSSPSPIWGRCAAFPTTTRWAWPRRRSRRACATWRPASARRAIRVNGISAGPIKTLAASGIKGFGKILDVVAQNAPLRRNVTIDDVGNVAAFLLSDLAAGVTSEIVYVDGGFSHAMPGAA